MQMGQTVLYLSKVYQHQLTRTRITQTLGLHGRIFWPGKKSLVLYRDADG